MSKALCAREQSLEACPGDVHADPLLTSQQRQLHQLSLPPEQCFCPEAEASQQNSQLFPGLLTSRSCPSTVFSLLSCLWDELGFGLWELAVFFS